jgi:NAD dependent epimerase/dehydratase family enzyme
MKVAITGASGMLGKALQAVLEKRGDQVLILERPKHWDPEKGTIDRELLVREAPDAVVNLSGEDISGRRWNEALKTRLRESRVQSTALIARTVAELPKKPSVLISASATGIYGDRGD